MSTVVISVIIPVYQEIRLIQCLQALEQQTLPQEHYEVIVVNNDPSSSIELTQAFNVELRIIEEAQAGSYAARNAGIKIARGTLLAFTDADCTPDAHWLESLSTRFETDTDVVALAGSIIQTQVDPPVSDVIWYYSNTYFLQQERYVKKNRAATANFAVKASVAQELNGFDASLLSGGDFDFCSRLVTQGYHIHYEPRAHVSHPVRTLKETMQKRRRLIGGYYSRGLYAGIGFLAIVRGFFPVRFSTMRLDKDVSFKIRVQLFLLLWLFKVTDTVEKIRLLLGKSPQRF